MSALAMPQRGNGARLTLCLHEQKVYAETFDDQDNDVHLETYCQTTLKHCQLSRLCLQSRSAIEVPSTRLG